MIFWLSNWHYSSIVQWPENADNDVPDYLALTKMMLMMMAMMFCMVLVAREWWWWYESMAKWRMMIKKLMGWCFALVLAAGARAASGSTGMHSAANWCWVALQCTLYNYLHCNAHSLLLQRDAQFATSCSVKHSSLQVALQCTISYKFHCTI